jgi:hypothetical protein
MPQVVVWPLISVRYTVTTSPLARGSMTLRPCFPKLDYEHLARRRAAVGLG